MLKRSLLVGLILLLSPESPFAQTTVRSCSPTPTTFQNWAGGFTFGDLRATPNVEIPAGATVTHIGVHSPIGGATIRPKIAQFVSAGTYNIVQNEASYTHNGGGEHIVALATPFTAPSTGYHVFAYIQGTASDGPTGSRASKSGDATGTGSYTIGSYPIPCLVYVIDGEGEPPPPPPPPPPPATGDTVHIMAGQSNGNLVASTSNAIFVSVFNAALGHNQTTLLNSAVGGSSIEQWKPGSSYLNNAISMFNSAIASGKTPGAFIYYQGEFESNFNADVAKSTLSVDTLRWDERFKAIAEAFRAGVNQPNLPVVVVVLHANHEAGRPYWDRIQLHQRNIPNPLWPYHVTNSINVDLSDLDGTTDGVHLTQALRDKAARRLATGIANKWFIQP